MRFRASEVAAVTGGTRRGPDVGVDGAAIDSRRVRGGELFVALRGERDGHDFIGAALEAGAAASLAAREVEGGTAVVVPDTARALADLGRAARDRLPDRVIGITGSVGKTSVKDLLAAALGRHVRTAASERSFNNELGVPLTLVNADASCEAVVVEMGARGAGHITELCRVARPTIGVVTVVAAAHTELFGTVEQVAEAKSELVADLPASGTAVLNADDERVDAMAGRTQAAVLRYGLERGEVRAEAVAVDAELRPSFGLRTPWGAAEVRLGVRGAHQVPNALAAAGAALAAGAPLDAVVSGLGEAALSPWRMELDTATSGTLVLNDAYNANPTSTAAALRSLAALPARRRFAFLGTMAELGATADADHRDTAALAARLDIRVIAVGEPAYGTEHVADVDAAAGRAAELELGPGDAVLVKGSRVAGLERLAGLLLGRG